MVAFTAKNSCMDLAGVAVIDSDVTGGCSANSYFDAEFVALTTQRFRGSDDQDARGSVVSDEAISTNASFPRWFYSYPNSSYYAEQKEMYEDQQKDC
jgi:hypothetical protein